MFTVFVQNEPGYVLDEARLQAAVQIVLAQQNASPGSSLTIVVTDDESVAALNRQFRGLDAPTDVLSFPADAPPPGMDDEPLYLGDLVIAYPYATAQAISEGHELNESLALLVVHGTLHLLGYDHNTPRQRDRMWAEQARTLRSLGISPEIVPALENLEHET